MSCEQFLNKPLPGALLDCAHPLARGLVGCWLMNDGGWRCFDLSPYKNHGRLVCADLNVRRSSLGVAFDGVDDYVSMLSSIVLATGTYSFLVNPRSLNPIALESNVLQGNLNFLGRIYISLAGEVALETDTNNQIFTVGLGITINQWQHVVLSRSGDKVMFYLNGVNKGSQSIVAANVTTINKINSHQAATMFNGTIGLVRIWNRALSVQEVKDLYLDPYGMFIQ